MMGEVRAAHKRTGIPAVWRTRLSGKFSHAFTAASPFPSPQNY